MASDGEDDCPELLLKVIVCGDSGVGKTALLERMFSNRFDPRLPSTIGTDQRFKRLNVDGVSVGVSFWDTAGQERFQSLTPMYFRGAHGVILVYDVTRPETLDGLADKWLPEFRAHATRRDAVTMVVGNKTDLTTERVVAAEAGAAFARAQGCLYREVSAKADAGGVHDGVYDALMWGMVSTILDAPGLLNAAPSNDTGTRVRVRDGGSRGRSGCC